VRTVISLVNGVATAHRLGVSPSAFTRNTCKNSPWDKAVISFHASILTRNNGAPWKNYWTVQLNLWTDIRTRGIGESYITGRLRCFGKPLLKRPLGSKMWASAKKGNGDSYAAGVSKNCCFAKAQAWQSHTYNSSLDRLKWRR
jgi:hypothetical protein